MDIHNHDIGYLILQFKGLRRLPTVHTTVLSIVVQNRLAVFIHQPIETVYGDWNVSFREAVEYIYEKE